MVDRLVILLSLLFVGSVWAMAPEDPGWPRVITKNGKELTIYQPQVDFWRDYRDLHFRCAIAVKTGKAEKAHYGVAEVDAETAVDHAARVVEMTTKSRDLRFPNASASSVESLRRTVDELYPADQPVTVALDRVLACLDPEKEPQQRTVPLDLDPPRIFHSDKPAILATFLGEPQLQPVAKGQDKLMFVVNTNWDVLYDTASQRYFLLNKDSWLTTADPLKGPWLAAKELPEDLSSLPSDENWADVRANIPGRQNENPPLVFASSEPAELVLTQGNPRYAPIPGTKLMRVSNTGSALFLNTADGAHYLLVAGRWFRASSLDGPWTAASADLPADFSRIPDADPAAYVKASVPGTTNARDAVMLASIPNTTQVNPDDAAKAEAAYDGEPDFKPIPNTAVSYAANSSDQIFFVENTYYWCKQGTWLQSASPAGPWAYSANVPSAIYSIPPSHPAHNVTYVTVQNSTPSSVTYGQTSGYSGEYVATTGVLMLGAGLLVGALAADRWNDHDDHHYYSSYPVPYSYGCGARYSYAHGGYYRAAPVAYGPYGGVGAGARYNPSTGTYARGAYAYGPAGSASARQAYNPSSGARARTARVDTAYGSAGRGAAYDPSTGEAARGGYRSGERGSAGGVRTNQGTGAAAWDAERGRGAVGKSREGDVYAGKDGVVYKKDSAGSWSSNSGDGWEPVSAPQPRTSSPRAATSETKRGEASSGSGAQARQEARTQASRTIRGQADRPERTDTARQSGSRVRQAPQASTQELETQARARQRGNQLTRQVSEERQFGDRGSGDRGRSSGRDMQRGGAQRGGGMQRGARR